MMMMMMMTMAKGLPLSPSVFGIDDKVGILMSRAGEGIELTP